ncbi:MAG: hypothetical protein U1A78_41690 [Polyangia bacterium]
MTETDRPLPLLVVKPPQHRFVEQVLESLKQSRNLGLYKRNGQIVRVVTEDADLPKGVERPPEAPAIRTVGKATLRLALTRCAEYHRVTRTLRDGTEITEPCHPPEWAVEGVQEAESWPLPPLEGIVEAPVLLRSGEVLQQPGYDAYSGLVFIPPKGVVFREVPTHPTAGDVKTALHWLHEAVFDFPFAQPIHRSAWMAGVLSYFARPAYGETTPFFLVDGNVRGAGKGKLFKAASLICLGRKGLVMQQGSDDKTERELITAALLAGEMMVLVDNIARPFGSASFDSAIGEGVWNPVLKYENVSSRFPIRTIFWGNGNNVSFRKHSDTVRRTLKIRIESPHENPEQRTDFKRPEPGYSRWLRANRAHLVWSALTILRGFVAAGSPQQAAPWGTFESWSELVRSALIWAGEPDPYEAAATHDQSSDGAVEALGEVLRGWQRLCASLKAEDITTAEALSALQGEQEQRRMSAAYRSEHEPLIQALCELCETTRLPDGDRLGYTLRRYKRRPVGGLMLEAVMRRQKRTAWKVTESP